MRFRTIFLALTVMLSATASSAAVMEVAPGAPINLDSIGTDMVQMLVANSGQFAELVKYGNKITEAKVQYYSPDVTRFFLTVQQCQLNGCTGGARLIATRYAVQIAGLFPPYRYDVRIEVLKP